MNDSLPDDHFPTREFSTVHHTPADDLDDEAPTPRMAGVPEAAAPAELPCIPGYEVLEVLGRGGMGVVYKARQLPLNRLVALKVLRGGEGKTQARARFRREAAVMARLLHPGIVQVYELGAYC